MLLWLFESLLCFLVKVKKSGSPYFLRADKGETDLESGCLAQLGMFSSDMGGGILGCSMEGSIFELTLLCWKYLGFGCDG